MLCRVLPHTLLRVDIWGNGNNLEGGRANQWRHSHSMRRQIYLYTFWRAGHIHSATSYSRPIRSVKHVPVLFSYLGITQAQKLLTTVFIAYSEVHGSVIGDAISSETVSQLCLFWRISCQRRKQHKLSVYQRSGCQNCPNCQKLTPHILIEAWLTSRLRATHLCGEKLLPGKSVKYAPDCHFIGTWNFAAKKWQHQSKDFKSNLHFSQLYL